MILLPMAASGIASSIAPTIETLDRNQCLELLQGARVGRFGTTLDAMPAVLPVNFVLLESDVLVRTIPGSRLDAAVTNAVVAFKNLSKSPLKKEGTANMRAPNISGT